jgi:hypothetical protein
MHGYQTQPEDDAMGITAHKELKQQIEDCHNERDKSVQGDFDAFDLLYSTGGITRDDVLVLFGFLKGMAQARLNQIEAARRKFALAPKQPTKGKAR